MSYQEIFTADEWTELKNAMNAIRDRIPENQMNRVWNAYQRISKDNSHMPCSCASAAKYWINAVNTINDYIKKQNMMIVGDMAKEINNQEKI